MSWSNNKERKRKSDGGVKEEGKKVRGVGKREKGKMVKLLWLIVSIENLEVTIAKEIKIHRDNNICLVVDR